MLARIPPKHTNKQTKNNNIVVVKMAKHILLDAGLKQLTSVNYTPYILKIHTVQNLKQTEIFLGMQCPLPCLLQLLDASAHSISSVTNR